MVAMAAVFIPFSAAREKDLFLPTTRLSPSAIIRGRQLKAEDATGPGFLVFPRPFLLFPQA
jgi:hypothetical protein